MNGKTEKVSTADAFGTEEIWKLLLRIAPPVMLSQLIQALYNIVDSYFVGRYSADGLTALSAIFPTQLMATAIAVGTGVGVNALMARQYAVEGEYAANKTAGMGMVLALISWAVFALWSVCFLRPFVASSVQSPKALEYTLTYGHIVCIGSLGLFVESCWSKVHQAEGNMKLPMAAQITGALVNILLDPLLIFGVGPFPRLGVAGAAIATVAGQVMAALIVGRKGIHRPPAIKGSFRQYAGPIYRFGIPSIFMQLLYVVYIMALNVILAGFSDAAVTVLGLYYKLQTFFFIPLFALQTCIVPVLSYNYAAEAYGRCREIVRDAILLAALLMTLGVICFEGIPAQLIGVFSDSREILRIGVPAFRIIACSFLPAVLALLWPTVFQAVGKSRPSMALSLVRQIFCLIPLFYLLSRIGLSYVWLAFPASELITAVVGTGLYLRERRTWKQ